MLVGTNAFGVLHISIYLKYSIIKHFLKYVSTSGGGLQKTQFSASTGLTEEEKKYNGSLKLNFKQGIY